MSTTRAVAILAAALLLAGLSTTSAGSWVESLFYENGVQWKDAYTTFETAQKPVSLPQDARQRALLLAMISTDDEPPVNLTIGSRLHPPSALVRLRYETFDERGELESEWRVRSLIPSIGVQETWGFDDTCWRECHEELARGKATRLVRSGDPGMSEAWVSRMPVGMTFDLVPRTLQTQDILDKQTRRIGVLQLRVGNELVTRPSRIKVTLEEACPARVRVGSVTKVEFAANAIIPIPVGFEVNRWVQLQGCGALEAYPSTPR